MVRSLILCSELAMSAQEDRQAIQDCGRRVREFLRRELPPTREGIIAERREVKALFRELIGHMNNRAYLLNDLEDQLRDAWAHIDPPPPPGEEGREE